MAKQTFTVGQVLTASQLTSLQQTAMLGGAASAKTASYTLVAADAGTTISMTSTSATTITVNTGLFAAGDTVFIQNLGSGNLTVTAGTATVSTAGSLILPTNDAGILYFVSTGVAVFYDFIQVGAASPLTTKGDLYGFSTLDARVPIGANATVLTADSTETLGLKWAAPAASGGLTLLSTTSLSSTSTQISISASTYTNLRIIVRDIYMSAANESVFVRLNADTGANYSFAATELIGTTNSANSSIGDTKFRFSPNNTSNNTLNQKTQAQIFIPRCNDTDLVQFYASVSGYTGSAANGGFIAGRYDNSAAITSITFASLSAATFSGGTVYVYGES